MSKLPINFLLYTLSLGLLGGVGWVFYQATFEAPKHQKKNPEIKTEVETLIGSGQKRQPPERFWFYGDKEIKGQETDAWWSKLFLTNWIGKLPPEPVKTDSQPTTKVTTGTRDTPLNDVLTVIALIHHSAQASSSGCSVRYKASAGVTPPASAAGSGGPSDIAATPTVTPTPPPGPGPTRPGGAGPGRPGGAMPVAFDQSSMLVQHLKLEDTLWPPYQNVRLVAIAEDASRAWFLREKDGVPKEQWKKEDVLRSELAMSEDLVRVMDTVGAAGGRAGSRPTASRPVAKPTSWTPVEVTREVTPGHYHVSEKDAHEMQNRGDRILSEDLVASNYVSPSGNFRGVMIDKVSPELARYGVVAGDVIQAINGEQVKSKAEAAVVAKRQYERGTREFVVDMVSRGEQVQRTYHAPNRPN